MTVERFPSRPGVIRTGPAGRLRDVLVARRNSRDSIYAAALDRERTADLGAAWAAACERVPALSVRVQTPSGLTVVTPKVVVSSEGPPVELLVQLRPGMLPDDVTANAARLASAVGARTLQVTGVRGGGWITVRLAHGPDPLQGTLDAAGLVVDPWGVVLGRDESGALVSGDVTSWPHMVFQGTTTAGKSALLRWLLVQVAARPDVEVVGSDPSGSLWRPWPAHPQRVTGLRDVAAHVELLEREVAEMDARLSRLPVDADRVTTSAALPLRLVVCEEYPGLLRAADVADKQLGVRVRLAVGRLLAESHKAGVRVLVVVQRADAKVLGGFDRSNLGMAISFRTDREGVKMLHPAAADDVVEAHAAAPAGVALMTAPAVQLVRLRAPWLSYQDYSAAITAACLPDLAG